MGGEATGSPQACVSRLPGGEPSWGAGNGAHPWAPLAVEPARGEMGLSGGSRLPLEEASVVLPGFLLDPGRRESWVSCPLL